jgi:hypothetical protein
MLLNQIGQLHGKKLEKKMNLNILIHYQYQHLKIISFYYSFIFVCFLEYVKKIISFIGMQPCEQSDKVAENKIPHTLYLAGIHRGGHDVLVRVRMVSEGTSADYPSTTTTIQLTIRSTDKSAVQVIASVIAYVNKQ